MPAGRRVTDHLPSPGLGDQRCMRLTLTIHPLRSAARTRPPCHSQGWSHAPIWQGSTGQIGKSQFENLPSSQPGIGDRPRRRQARGGALPDALGTPGRALRSVTRDVTGGIPSVTLRAPRRGRSSSSVIEQRPVRCPRPVRAVPSAGVLPYIPRKHVCVWLDPLQVCGWRPITAVSPRTRPARSAARTRPPRGGSRSRSRRRA